MKRFVSLAFGLTVSLGMLSIAPAVYAIADASIQAQHAPTSGANPVTSASPSKTVPKSDSAVDKTLPPPLPISPKQTLLGAGSRAVVDEPPLPPLEAAPKIKDPFQPLNRVIFKFNTDLDNTALKPIAKVYKAIVPEFIRNGITNVFSNFATVPTIANDLLQFNFYQAISDTWRLGINTTVGIGGFFDVASHIGLAPNTTDFGITLGKYGYKNSTYIVIPFLGPSTIRDGVSIPIQYYLMSVYPYIHTPERYGVLALFYLNARANLLKFENVIRQAAIDRYVFVRDAYIQKRASQIQRSYQQNNPYLEKPKQTS